MNFHKSCFEQGEYSREANIALESLFDDMMRIRRAIYGLKIQDITLGRTKGERQQYYFKLVKAWKKLNYLFLHTAQDTGYISAWEKHEE